MIERLDAASVDSVLARQFAVLLGRAFTDERHTERFSDEHRRQLGPAVERVHAAPPAPGELMPEPYLTLFPTLRNFARPPAERREGYHFVARAEGYLASQVSLFAQRFALGEEALSGGYIEDVATDPLHLREGLATSAMRAAEAWGRELELDVLGLATGIGEFYRRLGWEDWTGHHTLRYTGTDFSEPDEPLMLLPLTAAGERFSRRAGDMLSWRLSKFGETPDLD